MPQKPVGSVMVVGGGIAGMQAALDLADSGYYVHLVEKTSAIGGVMSERVGQDIPYQRLRHVNYLPETGRGRPASEHQPYHLCGDRKG